MWPLNRQPAIPAFSSDAWMRASAGQAVLEILGQTERERLWALAHAFLHSRSIQPVGNLTLDDRHRLRIALLVALPVLGLDLGWYRGLHELIIYPDAFAPNRNWIDEYGIAHTGRQALSGEAWDEGLILLSWADIEAAGPLDGHHVVLHECAHWLDLQNGAANGRPPLHRDMDPTDWTHHFSVAYADFSASPRHCCAALDPYAAENPAEFFAVCCELFFERPQALHDCWPDIHRLLVAFFRQRPDDRIHPDTGRPS
ncbi:hypothetical protein BI364_11530 [Acidihalobacter yilgarnensis]|uniref:Zinc-dependent peptidase n=1 Tax=Acidihalobacter yilgarnensis TaxID=2819280 RepID=A0A1D8IPW3_9GAMM|nr:M90 family metallopeptidase [Acidihalobacter yilgarnensis]AOU98499.1 hypothetical protein BI364_11530 [Acidihalobacter yilgarnensis]